MQQVYGHLLACQTCLCNKLDLEELFAMILSVQDLWLERYNYEEACVLRSR